MVDRLLFRAVQSNAPRHADKDQLLPPHARPDAMFDSLRGCRADLAGVVEMWPGVQREATARPGWESAMPFPNHPKIGVGNGFAWEGNALGRKGRARDITARIETEPNNPRLVHMPLVKFVERDTGLVVPVLVGHAPRMKLDPAGNRRVQHTLIDTGRRVAKRHGRCLVMGDMNDGNAWVDFQEAGADVIHDHVEVMAAFGDIRLRNRFVIERGVRSVWSDHPLLGADVYGRG